MKFEKTTNKNILLIFLALITLILLQNNKFFRKLYNVHGVDLNTRLINVYGYCGKHSYGFLKEVKNKYSLKKNPKIADYVIQPKSSWLAYDTSKETSDKTNIILNYEKNLELKFIQKDNIFISETLTQGSSGIKEIKFTVSDPLNKIHGIEIFKIIDNNKIIILKKEISFLTAGNNSLVINHDTKLINSRREPIYIALKNLDSTTLQKINNITLILKNKYQILDKDVLLRKGNCFYTK